ncbi:hypothetical protein HaLaN_06049, partial [Haematococcus lacustris]
MFCAAVIPQPMLDPHCGVAGMKLISCCCPCLVVPIVPRKKRDEDEDGHADGDLGVTAGTGSNHSSRASRHSLDNATDEHKESSDEVVDLHGDAEQQEASGSSGKSELWARKSTTTDIATAPPSAPSPEPRLKDSPGPSLLQRLLRNVGKHPAGIQPSHSSRRAEADVVLPDHESTSLREGSGVLSQLDNSSPRTTNPPRVERPVSANSAHLSFMATPSQQSMDLLPAIPDKPEAPCLPDTDNAAHTKGSPASAAGSQAEGSNSPPAAGLSHGPGSMFGPRKLPPLRRKVSNHADAATSNDNLPLLLSGDLSPSSPALPPTTGSPDSAVKQALLGLPSRRALLGSREGGLGPATNRLGTVTTGGVAAMRGKLPAMRALDTSSGSAAGVSALPGAAQTQSPVGVPFRGGRFAAAPLPDIRQSSAHATEGVQSDATPGHVSPSSSGGAEGPGQDGRGSGGVWVKRAAHDTFSLVLDREEVEDIPEDSLLDSSTPRQMSALKARRPISAGSSKRTSGDGTRCPASLDSSPAPRPASAGKGSAATGLGSRSTLRHSSQPGDPGQQPERSSAPGSSLSGAQRSA